MVTECDAFLESVYFAEWYGKKIACGWVSQDSKGRFCDGEFIHTSAIKGIEGDILQTKNTRHKIKSFGGEIGEWIKENNIDIETIEGQIALKLRWF